MKMRIDCIFPSGGGALKERPSREKLDKMREAAQRAMGRAERAKPKTQDRARIESDRVALQATIQDKEFSWRKAGGVSPAQQQSTCGACYHFAAIGALEGNYAAKHNGTIISASEQHLLNCAPGQCGDGYLSESLAYLVSHGTSSRGVEPFHIPPQVDACNLQVPIVYRAIATDFVAADGGIPSGEEMKKAILEHGPIGVFLYADGMNGPGFQNTDVLITDDSASGNHVLIITGWDDDKSAWEVKNSWGQEWGRNGFGFIKYGIRDIGDNAQWVLSQT